MTQEVQPLTWSKRTNIEEHQQFFSKINEIIGNLAPTVDEAEQAIAQATAAIASANDAVATANAASAAASAAASQAQTAATTVAGYDGRLTAAEGNIDALQAADQTMTGSISALGSRMTAVESKNSQQDTAIDALQTADGQNVKLTGEHAIGSYAVLLTGNQDKSGILNLLSRTDYPNRSIDIFNPPTYVPRGIAEVKAGPGDANTVMREELTFATGGNSLAFTVHCGDADGVTDHTATLMLTVFRDGKARLQLQRESGTVQIVPQG